MSQILEEYKNGFRVAVTPDNERDKKLCESIEILRQQQERDINNLAEFLYSCPVPATGGGFIHLLKF